MIEEKFMSIRFTQSRRLVQCLFLLCALSAISQAQALYEQCEVLAASAKPEVERHLAALKDKDAQVRIKAASELAKTCEQRAVAPLISLLKDADPLARVAAVEALGQLGDRAAVEPLIAAISDEDWRVRLALGRSLASFQYYEASYAALNALGNPQGEKVKDEGDMRARCAALIAVNQLRDVRFSRKAVTILFGFLDDEREPLRRIAEQAMFELKNTRNGYHELIGILKQHNSPAFREKAAYWLGRLGIQAARSALGQASVGDRDPRVQQVAKDALALLKESGGQ
jgi:HEAT repeat protein